MSGLAVLAECLKLGVTLSLDEAGLNDFLRAHLPLIRLLEAHPDHYAALRTHTTTRRQQFASG